MDRLRNRRQNIIEVLHDLPIVQRHRDLRKPVQPRPPLARVVFFKVLGAGQRVCVHHFGEVLDPPYNLVNLLVSQQLLNAGLELLPRQLPLFD